MNRYFTPIFLIILIFIATSGYAASTASNHIDMIFDLSQYPIDKDVKLWIPYPVSSQYQDISDIQISGNFTKSAIYTDKKFNTPMLFAQWPIGTTARNLRFSFNAVRLEVIRRDFTDIDAPWDPTNFSKWLEPTNLGPIDGPVKKLAESITKDKKTMLTKAKAIYDWICDNMYREPATTGCGKGDVCALLKKPGGKCTDIHSVFVAICRAVGIPAREIFGIRLGKKEIQNISKWQHCWAEFYLPGYGWIPVDPADVRKLMLKKNLALNDPQTVELRNYFWGGWDAFRVKLAMGRDLTLTPTQKGPSLNTFGYPYAEVSGNPLNFHSSDSFKYTFTATKR